MSHYSKALAEARRSIWNVHTIRDAMIEANELYQASADIVHERLRSDIVDANNQANNLNIAAFKAVLKTALDLHDHQNREYNEAMDRSLVLLSHYRNVANNIQMLMNPLDS